MNHIIEPETFASTLIQWAKLHGRHDLPWQKEPIPYRVLVSEIMLQQTQVSTVIPYFERWMQRFPCVASLAMATEDEIMALWQGLGYYSRARNLHKAACFLMDTYQGEFPTSLEELLQIPGVGRYTAGAIVSFAHNNWGPLVDGNVKRVFCRLFGVRGVPGTGATDKTLWHLAETLCPHQHNRAYAQGLMDMGATLCTPKNPACERCPFMTQCVAYNTHCVDDLPERKQKKPLPVKEGHFLWIQSGEKLLLEKRASDGIWPSLWCLPEIKQAPANSRQTPITTFEHTFSHYKLKGKIWLQTHESACKEQCWFDHHELETIGLPAPIRKLLQRATTPERVADL